MSRRLTLDVSINEMLELREKVGSNKLVAKQLGVCYNTILRHIGPQPKKPKDEKAVGSVGKAMIKALNAKHAQEPKRSMQNCKTCSNRGIACSFCLRNPMLKDYYQKGE